MFAPDDYWKIEEYKRQREEEFKVLNRSFRDALEYEKFKKMTDEKILETIEKEENKKEISAIREKQKNTVNYSLTKDRIFIWIGGDTGSKLSFSGNRFLYIKKIIKSGPVRINELGRIGSTSEKTNISTTIKDINQRFIEKFTVSENLIENVNNRSGYSLNKNMYQFVLRK